MKSKCCHTCSQSPAFIAVFLNQKPCPIIGKLLDSNKYGANGSVENLVWINKFTRDHECNAWTECDEQTIRLLRTMFDEKLKQITGGVHGTYNGEMF